MNLRFQYNKTSLQLLNKQLRIRLRALPTLKNKESALRMEVKHANIKILEMKKFIEKLINEQGENLKMWNEFDSSLLAVEDIQLNYRKIAGVLIPELAEIIYRIADFNIFLNPKWYLDGIEILKKLIRLEVEKDLSENRLKMLEFARKKTTQKVNLYEKVQIPTYLEAIMKIKRFLEDEENLTKAAQKIVKTRQQQTEEVMI